MSIKIYTPEALNEIGKRSNNEDRIFPYKGMQTSDDKLFVVCDGMGGHEKGEVASEIVCNTISEYISTRKINDLDEWHLAVAFNKAQEKIDEFLRANPEASGMGTTLAMIHINSKSVTIAHCGDSRVYQIRNGKIIFKTEDHSLVNELLRSNIINEDEAANHPKKNVITRAMQGLSSPVKADITIRKDVNSGDTFFLCSDGITETLNDNDIVGILQPNKQAAEAIQQIDTRCRQTSNDNYSCYLVNIEHADSAVIADPRKPVLNQNTNNNSPLRTNKLLYPAIAGTLFLVCIVLAILLFGKNNTISDYKQKMEDVTYWKECAYFPFNDSLIDSYKKKYAAGEFINHADSISNYMTYLNEEDSVWNKALHDNLNSEFDNYQTFYPDGRYVEASVLIRDLNDWIHVLRANKSDQESLAKEYIINHPNGRFISETETYIDPSIWRDIIDKIKNPQKKDIVLNDEFEDENHNQNQVEEIEGETNDDTDIEANTGTNATEDPLHTTPQNNSASIVDPVSGKDVDTTENN